MQLYLGIIINFLVCVNFTLGTSVTKVPQQMPAPIQQNSEMPFLLHQQQGIQPNQFNTRQEFGGDKSGKIGDKLIT